MPAMFRRQAALLLALILALHGLLHALCPPGMAGDLAAICSANGLAKAPAGTTDDPAKEKPDCPACQIGMCAAAVVPAAPIEMPTPSVAAVQLDATARHDVILTERLPHPPARGPPANG